MPNRITLSRTIARRILSTVVLCGFVHSGAIASDVPIQLAAKCSPSNYVPATVE